MKSSIASQMAKSMNFAQKPPPNQQDDSLERLSLFERYYTALDSEADGSISLAETYEWLSFTCSRKPERAVGGDQQGKHRQ